MLICCKICHREYVASKKSTDEHFICSRCQTRGREQQHKPLGLHPALERKWAHNQREARENYPSVSSKASHEISQRHLSLSDTGDLPKIPGFDISYQIGRGAMGSVYRARQIKTGQLVAIKVLACDLSERADLVARFEREAYALKSLTNPNVVSIIDAGHVGDIHYFAMEFIDGITLRARINQSPIDAQEACFIIVQILNGLKAAHQHGIVHRDLKPENVLLAYEGRSFKEMPARVVLVDFGLVGIGGLAFDPHPNLTRSRVTMGTVNYMAPEQHIDAKRVDYRSDLYSAGVIFFEILTKELPLGRYLLPRERGMDVPPLIDEILSMALARKVEERYASADQFLNDLKKINFTVPARDERNYLTVRDNWFTSIKSHFYKARYAFLLIIAGLFIAFGVKLSKSYDESAAAHQHTKKHKS